MHQTRHTLFAILILATMFVLPVELLFAQSGGFTGSFSRIGFGPRGMAMGNALTAVHQEGAYGYYNPAMAATPNEFIQLDFSSSAMAFDRQLHMVSAQFQLPPSAGISVSLINGRIGDIDGRTQSGYYTETFSTSEYQLLTNFGIRFSDTFWGGVGIKVNLADFHSDVSSETSIGLDAGLYKQSGKVGIGIAVQDLFAQTNYDTSELFGSNTGGARSDSYPTRFKLGVSYQHNPELLVSADYEIRVLTAEVKSYETQLLEGRPVTSAVRSEITTNSQIGRIGARYRLHPRVTVRSGLQAIDINHDSISLQPTAGFSLHLPFDRLSPAIDYAFVREPSNISTMHVFSIRLQL
jgi:hypothetical protein